MKHRTGWLQDIQKYGTVYYGDGILCYVRIVGKDPKPIYKIESEMSSSGGDISGLRPVFTLRGDLKIVSGDGQSERTAYRFN